MCIWSVSERVAEFPVPFLTSQLHAEAAGVSGAHTHLLTAVKHEFAATNDKKCLLALVWWTSKQIPMILLAILVAFSQFDKK